MGGVRTRPLRTSIPLMLRRALREPLTQFLLVGLLIFGVARLIPGDSGRYDIDVDQALQQIDNTYRAQFGGPPKPEQRRALLDAYIREEIFYREGMAIGLAEDDVIVRRRIAQKFAFASEDLAAIEDPGDDQLQRYYSRHADRYREPVRVRYRQIYFSNADGASAMTKARHALNALRQDRPVTGDEFPGPNITVPMALAESERLFGASPLTAALSSAPVGEWSGPYETGYGQHLLLVVERLPARLPPLSELRQTVLSDFRQQRNEKHNDAEFRRLLSHYRLVGGPAPE